MAFFNKKQWQNIISVVPKKNSNLTSRVDDNFHDFIFSNFKGIVKNRTEDLSKGRRHIHKSIETDLEKYSIIVAKAYRSFAKSTTFALLLPLYLILTGRKKYIVLVGSNRNAGSKLLTNISKQLERNKSLKEKYRYSIVKANMSVLELSVGDEFVKIQAFGIDSKDIRGLNDEGRRPDLVIGDDLSNDKNVLSQAQRDYMHDVFNESLLNLKDSEDDKFSVLVLGTVLHPDDIISRLSAEKGNKVFSYKLILQFPNEKQTEILKSLFHSIETKNEFRELLEKPENENLLSGMEIDNEALRKSEVLFDYFSKPISFMKEKQNEPVVKSSDISISYYRELPKNLIFYGSLDPSLGKKKGDYQGISVVGYEKKSKRMFVVFSKRMKRQPHELVGVIKELVDMYNIKLFTIESNQFQSFFADSIKEQAPNLPIKKAVSRQDKNKRLIATLDKISAGKILLPEHNTEIQNLTNEIKNFGTLNHDDTLDSLSIIQIQQQATNSISFSNARNSFI
jgi:predicted phage terminase large subunit-like protein